MNITEIINNSNEPQWYSYISYILNIILLLTTIISEYMGQSKCKGNGIVDGIQKSVSGHIEEQKQKNIKKTILDNQELILSLFEKFKEKELEK